MLLKHSASADNALGFRRRFGYGVGDFGFNLFFTTAGLYLLFYYTEVLELPPSTAGWVFAAALIWDAIFDPMMGYIANRTRTRWGRYRPYLLFGAVPLAASWMIMFIPTGYTGTALVIFAIAAHMLFRTVYAIVTMPFLALSAVLTTDSKERSILTAYRMASAFAAGLFIAIATLPLVDFFGGGQEGFLKTAILYGIAGAGILLFVFANTHEEEILDTAPADPSMGQMFHMLKRNRAFWLVCGGMLAGSAGGTFLSKSLPYHFKYAFEREDLISAALGVMPLSMALTIPLWTWIMTNWSKRAGWAIGISISLLSFLLLWWAPSPTWFLVLLAFYGAGSGAGAIGFWSMMPDTVEYGAWRSGVRAEGAIFGFVSLIQKASLGLAAAGLGELLSLIGYKANIAQSPETLSGLKIVMLGAPVALYLVALVFVLFYPITPTLHARMIKALAWRERGRSKKESYLI